MLIISKDTTLLFSFLNTVWCMQKPYVLTQWFCTAKKKDQALFQNAYILFYVLHKNSTSSSNITTSTSVFSRQTRNKNGRVYCRFLHYWTHELLLSVFKDFQYCSTFLLGIFYSSGNFLLDLLTIRPFWNVHIIRQQQMNPFHVIEVLMCGHQIGLTNGERYIIRATDRRFSGYRKFWI